MNSKTISDSGVTIWTYDQPQVENGKQNGEPLLVIDLPFLEDEVSRINIFLMINQNCESARYSFFEVNNKWLWNGETSLIKDNKSKRNARNLKFFVYYIRRFKS